MFNCANYFYSQNKKNRFQQRRLRIIDDSFSTFGDRATVVFRGRQDTDAESTGGLSLRQRRPSTAIVRPGSSRGRHVAIAPTASVFPPIDPSGPKLVSAENQNIEDSEIHHTEKKLEFLKEVEAKTSRQQIHKRKNDWDISEAKFASSSILSNLSKYLYQISDTFEVTLPVDLVNDLVQKYDHLITDTVVEKRTWQTDCYQDFRIKNKQPFLTGVPKEEKIKEKINRFLGKIVKRQQSGSGKHVHLKQRSVKKKMTSPERPMTARSVMSNYSIKSDFSQPSDDGRESRYDYDLLPPELRPNILHYRRESSTPRLKTVKTTPTTRLEKLKIRKNTTTPKSSMKKTTFATENNSDNEKSVVAEKIEEDATDLGSAGKMVMTTIPFSMADLNFRDKGWTVTPGDSQDPEAKTLLMWEKQLKEFMRNREEQKVLAKQRGEDGPLFVKFYNDPQIRTLRTKSHQRSATFPMPTILSKLPPSVTSFSTPSPNEGLLIGEEGLKVFVLTLPDGSGYCNYHSGRIAVSISRYHGLGKGVYTLVFDDCEGSPLIAYFTPSGSGCSHHPNGSLRMLFNKEGGSIFDEDSYIIRKWVWPTNRLNLPIPVNIQLNANLSLRCTSLHSMLLRFSCRGQSHKFSLTPSIESLEGEKVKDFTQGMLLSGAPFSSKSAISRVLPLPSVGSNEDSHPATIQNWKGKKKRTEERDKISRTMSAIVSEDEESAEHALMEIAAQQLVEYREKIKSLVDSWMDHYREAIGIALPNRLLSSSRKVLAGSSSSSRENISHSLKRLVQSSMSYYPGEGYSRPSRQSKHARSHTHPLPTPISSRTPSPLLPLIPVTRVPSTGSVTMKSRSPTPNSSHRTVSPLDYVKDMASSAEQRKPFKTGISKSISKPVRTATGCALGLHNMLLKNLETMPTCKCEKRHIPYISDLEYDIFLRSHVPRTQLVIVCAVSSVLANSCPCEPMLNTIYCSQNRMRFSPCTQCCGDPFRLLKYDICAALKDLRSTKPLLVERHNVTPGMFLMYMGGRLVHADRMFNGYGTTKKDFMKQVQHCIADGNAGSYLPPDFKLAHHNGSKLQSQNVWAYSVSGVMQALIPFTPESASGCMSRHSILNDDDNYKLEDSFSPEMSYGEDYMQRMLNESNSRTHSRASLLEASQAVSVLSMGEH